MHASNHRSAVVVVVGRKKKKKKRKRKRRRKIRKFYSRVVDRAGLATLLYCWAGYYRNDGYCTRETAWDIGLKRKSSSSYCCCP